MKSFNLEEALAGKPVVTDDGRPVKIAGFNPDANPDERLAAWVDGALYSFKDDGSRFAKISPTLFMAPTERKEWVVRYKTWHEAYNSLGPYTDIEPAKEIAELHKGTIHEITIIE
jgi:hypothetical protein